jgi:hypothetical protein
MADLAQVPMKPDDARKLARDIVENGVVDFSGHALDEMANDELHTTDCLNIVRAGVYSAPEYEKGELRYRVQTTRICVVVTFESDTRIRVVTAWRKK